MIPREGGCVVDLTSLSPCNGLLPLTIGDLALSEAPAATLTGIAPYDDGAAPLSKALHAAYGMTLPAANRSATGQGARLLWFGQRMYLLQGPALAPKLAAALADHAALTDQTDGWAVVLLEGTGAADVLARLTGIDLRHSLFRQDHTARTDLRHMTGSVTRVGAHSYQIMVFRSFAATLVQDLKAAMASVAARNAAG